MGTPAVIGDKLNALRRRYASRLAARIAELRGAVAAFLAGDRDRCEAAHRGAHSLAGSSGTFGYGDVSGAARAVEALLQTCLADGAPPAGAEAKRLSELLAELAALADAAGGNAWASGMEGRAS